MHGKEAEGLVIASVKLRHFLYAKENLGKFFLIGFSDKYMDKTCQRNNSSDINHYKKMSFLSSPQAEGHLPTYLTSDLLT